MDGVNFFAVKQNTLGKGCFPRIDVRANPDVPHSGNVDAHFVNILLCMAEYSKVCRDIQVDYGK
jgi:hypothetical protein